MKPGRMLFELGGVREDIAHEALQRAAQKLPIKCKIIGRDDVEAGGEQWRRRVSSELRTRTGASAQGLLRGAIQPALSEGYGR